MTDGINFVLLLAKFLIMQDTHPIQNMFWILTMLFNNKYLTVKTTTLSECPENQESLA